ncbi:MAG: nickel insertion protein, partial [Planctomycetota bacterium]
MDIKEIPNILRAILGDPLVGEGAGTVEVLETTIDDMNPQLYGHLTDALFESGAAEVFLTPVQ